VDFSDDVGSPVALELAPDGSLYYMTIFSRRGSPDNL